MGQSARVAGGNMMIDAAIEQRSGIPEEIAELVSFVCSERASYLTGTDIRIDGGAVAQVRYGPANEAFNAWDAQFTIR